MRKDGTIGDKLGPRLVELWLHASLAARRSIAPHEAKVRAAGTQIVIDRMGEELAEVMSPLLDRLLAENKMPDDLRDMVAKAASGKHQWQGAAMAILGMSGATSALGTVMSNYLFPVTRNLVGASPHLVPAPPDLAALVARGLITMVDGVTEAAAQGFNDTWFSHMVTAATNWPTQGDIRELMNRGQMNEATAIRFMGYNGVNPSTAPALLELRKQLLSPADAALAVLRGNMSEGDGLAVAAANGVSARDFKVVTDNTGEPLGLMQLLEAYRRHIIDRPRLVTGILQSRVRNDWIDVAEALRYGPMSTADAVNAVVQNQMPAAMAAEIADQNGLMPGHIDYLEKTAGEPLSRTEMEQLFNRGLVTEAEVIQALRESRLKNKYNADAFKLHVRMPEGRQIVSMITHGALTKAAGTDLLLQLGYSKQVAAALILEGTSTKLAVHHSLTLAEIRQLYADRIFTQAHCLDLMLKLGYDDADAHSLLSLWDLLAGAAMVRQAAGVIRSRYVGHKIDDTTAKTDLALLGVGAAAVARYIKVWAIERKASVKTLSEAQIVKAHKSGLLNLPDALKRLAAEGYDDVDSHILLGLPSGKALP